MSHKPEALTKAEKEYLRVMGDKAFERQRALALEAKKCTCFRRDRGEGHLPGPLHENGCQRWT